ncbi:hypothetical protein D3C84_1252970 [compost metagenome]
MGAPGIGLRHIGATVVFTGAYRADGLRGRLYFPQQGHFLWPVGKQLSDGLESPGANPISLA